MAGIGEFLSSMFSGIAGSPDGAHMRIWNELRPWLANLAPSATRKWLPRIASGVECEVPLVKRGVLSDDTCDHIAISACDVCHRPVCLHHARIDQYGDAICYICVVDAIKLVPPAQRARAREQGAPPPRERKPPPQQPKPGPTPLQVVEALQTLGLKPGVKYDAVKAAHRKLSAQNHPDKHKNSRLKASAEARFKEIQKAFEVLKTQFKEAS